MRHSGFVRQAGHARRLVRGHRHDPCMTQAGTRDRDVPGRLRAEFGHKDLGVYLRITRAGVLRIGDPLVVEPVMRPHTPVREHAMTEPAHAHRFICTACYFLFDPRTLDPAWSASRHLPETYRCPDCGAGRDACIPAAEFRPGS